MVFDALSQSLQKTLLWERRLAAIRAGGGAPTVLSLECTSGAFQDQNETVISSGKSCGETGFKAKIYATIGLFMQLQGKDGQGHRHDSGGR